MSTPRDSREPGTSGPADHDDDLSATYVKIVILEIATVLLLWWFGRAFS